jgi:hypothetical protein
MMLHLENLHRHRGANEILMDKDNVSDSVVLTVCEKLGDFFRSPLKREVKGLVLQFVSELLQGGPKPPPPEQSAIRFPTCGFVDKKGPVL